jgi:hypothetical protein
MRVLVVGAGASYAESKALNAPANLQMPLIKNFGRSLWGEFHPGNSLVHFLRAKGRVCDQYNALEEFFRCEEIPNLEINVEPYFEFFWHWRSLYQSPYGPEWWNVLYHGILQPLIFRMLMVFNESGSGWKPFPESDRIAMSLESGDLVVNLNYDTIFDIAIWRTHPKICYLPNIVRNGDIVIAKPHGSLNLLVDQEGFSFGSPENTGALPSKGAGFHYGFLPPRINKRYAQHEIAERIVKSIPQVQPTSLAFWGVGLTASDVELTELFTGWASTAKKVEAINPSEADVDRMATYLGLPIVRFDSVDHWFGKSIA